MEATASTRKPSTWKAVAPEQRVGEQKIRDFVPAEIEDQRTPVLMRALARIFVLITARCRQNAPAPSHRAENAPAPSQ